MGILSRIVRIVREKADALFGTAEDPQRVLDFSYEKQLELVRQARRSVVDITTVRRRLRLQAARLRDETERLEREAVGALQSGDEDRARQALQRKRLPASQLRELDGQIATLEREEQQLAEAEARLSAKVEAFRARKEVLNARYSSAEARVRIGEALNGMSAEMADVDQAMRHAEEKTRYLEARASAIDEMVADGLLTGGAPAGDRVDRAFDRLASGQDVDDELASLKRQLGSGGSSSAPAAER